MLARREQLNARQQTIVDAQTEPWGVKVTIVEVKDVELPRTMQRAMAKQAELEREGSEGKHQAGEHPLGIGCDVFSCSTPQDESCGWLYQAR